MEALSRHRPPVLAAASLAALLAAGCQSGTETPPNILLITIDTLHADHLSAWGYERETSPFLDSLAAEGVRFAEANVQWPKTGPSFASMFTATYPRDNGIVRRVGIVLPDSFRMLAEELWELGYATHAVVANGAVGRDFNFDQGFDSYAESWLHEPADGGDPTGARHVTDLALATARQLADDRPYFLWVHYLDPHTPYSPPPPYRTRFQDDALFAARAGEEIEVSLETSHREMTGIGYQQVLDNRTDLAFYIARYDAEIAYADAEIERLWDQLDELGHLEETVAVVTSDHGESLGEHHYYFNHGRFGFQTCPHVPLILHAPDRIEPGVVSRPVGLIDLAPTLLELAGAQLPEGQWRQGRSLLRHLGAGDDPPPEPEYVVSEAGYATDDQWQKILRWGRWKLIMARSQDERRWISGGGDVFNLYDLESDPGELHDVKREHRHVAKRLRGVLRAWLDRPPFDVEVEAGTGELQPREMTPETRQQLEALGYL